MPCVVYYSTGAIAAALPRGLFWVWDLGLYWCCCWLGGPGLQSVAGAVGARGVGGTKSPQLEELHFVVVERSDW